MENEIPDYSEDIARHNPNHKHGYMISIRREDFKIGDSRSSPTYYDIIDAFQDLIEELKSVPHHVPIKRCPDCGSALKRSRSIEVWYYVMTRDEALFEKKCRVLTVERAIERLESAVKRLRPLAAFERRYCQTCGARRRKRKQKVPKS